MMQTELYVTITGFNHYYGKKPFSIGKRVRCVKEPDNCYDDDAIKVVMPEIGKVGYIANSPYTKAEGTLSASRLYDRVGERFIAEVMFMTGSKIICRVLSLEETGFKCRVRPLKRLNRVKEDMHFYGPNDPVPF